MLKIFLLRILTLFARKRFKPELEYAKYHLRMKKLNFSDFEHMHLRRLFDFTKPDCVLDVGANTGQYRQMLRRSVVAYSDEIISIEPDPGAFSQLEKNFADEPKSSLLNIAISEKSGTQLFKIYNESQFNSFSTIIDEKLNPQLSVQRELDVPCQPLYELYKNQALSNKKSIHLKIDCQGYDLKVLESLGAETPSNITSIQIETSEAAIYEDAVNLDTLREVMTRRGFILSSLFPCNDANFPVLNDFDSVWIKRTLT